MSSKREAHNNLASYSKQIKSNNHVFSSQFNAPSSKTVTSPTKTLKKTATIVKKQNAAGQAAPASGQQTGHHRRSKTDGNANQLMFNSKPKENDHMKMMRHQLEKFEMMQGPTVQSRQNNVNININSKNNKNSNQSAQSAKLKQLSQNHSKMFSNLTMEQAAKNLKLINHSNVAQQQAPTRNTNLQSQPHNDKIVKQMCNLKSESSQNKKNSEKKKYTQTSELETIPPDKEDSIATPSGNMSIEQLKELMKNPQVAEFLKHQLELQQKGQNKIDSYRQSSRSHQVTDVAEQLPPKQSQRSNRIQQSQQFQICDATEGSNLNSDTSQEILRYQKEWAMKFNEQVGVHHNNDVHQYQPQDKFRQKDLNKASGDIYIESNQGRESSSLVQLKNEESKEQISLLPESAFVNINAITSLNNNMKHPMPGEEAKINFYEQKHDTEISTGNNTEVILKEGFKIGNKDKNRDAVPDPVEEMDDRGRNIMNGGRRLSFMTVNSDIMDNSADLMFDQFQEDSHGSKEDEDEYLTFQLCEGEEMNNEMANFIGIHMLNDGYLEGEEPQGKDDQEGGLTYQCPKTGSHFEFLDLIGRMRNLKQKRQVIDQYIQQEDQRQKKLKEDRAQKEQAKQKQIQKQKKQKIQVQNILRNAQEEGDAEENLNDSMPNAGDIMATDEDVILMDGSTHVNPHHITSGTKVSQNKLMGNIYQNTNDVAGPLQNQNKQGSKIYNTHDGRQKQQLEGQTPDGQKSSHYSNQYDSYANQNYPLGRTTAGPALHQKQGGVHHQASSLASNHASKISHFSKINQPTQNQTQPSLHEHQQQQMEMNLKYQQIVQNQPPPADLSNEKNYYKHGSSHQRGKSDDLQINTVNLTNNPQNLQNMQGKTVIHTNQLSSLADTGQNTHQFNTALGSQREDFQQRSHGMTKIKSNQFNNKLQKKISNQKPLDQKDGGSSVFKNGGTKSSMNRNDQNLKQTAQFGPQMNLIKSQLPNQQMVQSEVRISQGKNVMSQNQLQQQKMQNQFHKSKNFEVTRQGHNSGVTDQTKPQHYMTVGPGNHNQRGGMMMLQPSNALSMIQSQTQATESNKRGYVKKQGGVGATKSSDKQQSQKHVVQKQTTSNIYQTQQQRKTKLINSGGNLIVGYDVARGTSVGAMSNGSGPSIHSNQGIPNPQVLGGGSIGRNENQIQPTQPMSVVSSIPSTVQSASKKYQTHLTSEGSKVQHTNFSAGAPNLQSYSFDYRQQHQFMSNNQQMSGSSAPQTSQINSKKVMNNINSGVVRHTKNMRSFDSQHQQTAGVSQGGMMNQQKNYISSNQPGYGSKSNSANYMQNKQKSSSLNNPKESQGQNQVSQVQRSTNPAQILISKGIRLNDHGNKVHQLQTKTMADQPRDTFYKGMYKKVKSTTNQGLPHTENSLGRVNYNTAGSGNSKPSKNSQPKYQGDQNQLQVNLVHSDQYNICLNQNMNAFEDHQYPKKIQNLVGMESEGQTFQSSNPQSNKALYKSKRITANQRGVTSGTNARVNTFDNRGMQAAQNEQRHQNSHKNENRNQHPQGPHRVSVHQTNTQSHGAVTVFQHQNQGGRPTSSQGISSKNAEKQISQNSNIQGSQSKLVTQSQNQRNNGFMIQNFQNNNKTSSVHHQAHLSGGNPGHPSQSHQQQSPKKNIYLLNYQGNVSII